MASTDTYNNLLKTLNSSVLLLRRLRLFPIKIYGPVLRELQDQTRALCTLVLFLIDGGHNLGIIDKDLQLPLIRCGEQCDSRLKNVEGVNAEDKSYWHPTFDSTRHMLSMYMSTFIVGFAEKMLYLPLRPCKYYC
jgi:hypothetical protein